MGSLNFNPRTPCGVRPAACAASSSVKLFQSTHPVWGATPCKGDAITDAIISIHAPRVGCDLSFRFPLFLYYYFNPRTPCGVRHDRCDRDVQRQDFNPRTPCGVRRGGCPVLCNSAHISIHAPRVGCDSWGRAFPVRRPDFNPRTPCGVRRHCDRPAALKEVISIHAPRVGCDYSFPLSR